MNAYQQFAALYYRGLFLTRFDRFYCNPGGASTVGKSNKPEASVLSYWRAIEMFTPQSVPKLDRHNSVRQIFDPEDGLPWGPNGRRPRIPVGRDKVVRHTIYIGVYSIQDAYGVLDKIFEPDREHYDQRTPGDSACRAFHHRCGLRAAGFAVGLRLRVGNGSSRQEQGQQVSAC